MSELDRLRKAPTFEFGESGENARIARSDTNGELGESWRKETPKRVIAEAQKILGARKHVEVAYPLMALGPLAPACEAVAEGGQMAPAMAGQSLLIAAALLAQSLADVRTLAGTKPLSLYAFTIADSGDGKSTAEAVALHAIQEHQRQESEAYRARLAECETSKQAAGDPPRPPYRIMRDGTVEGIRQSFKHGVPSQGVFTSEAAIVVTGYGMTPDNKAKTCGAFNGLWDDGEVSVGRSTSGRVQLYDRRLSMHWLIQPEAALGPVMDPLMSRIGFWPRFLLAWPKPAAPRKAIPFHPERDRRIAAYWRECQRLLERELPKDRSNVSVIEPTPEAESLAGRFFELMEVAARDRNGELSVIKPFALRATEQAFRVAGVLAVMGRHDVIDAAAMRNAIELVGYSLESWRVLLGNPKEIDIKCHAMELIDWLVKQPDMAATETAIIRIGPRVTRSRSRRDSALATLEQAGLIRRVGRRWEASA